MLLGSDSFKTWLACDLGRFFLDSFQTRQREKKRKITQNMIWQVSEESGEFQGSLASGE